MWAYFFCRGGAFFFNFIAAVRCWSAGRENGFPESTERRSNLLPGWVCAIYFVHEYISILYSAVQREISINSPAAVLYSNAAHIALWSSVSDTCSCHYGMFIMHADGIISYARAATPHSMHERICSAFGCWFIQSCLNQLHTADIGLLQSHVKDLWRVCLDVRVHANVLLDKTCMQIHHLHINQKHI